MSITKAKISFAIANNKMSRAREGSTEYLRKIGSSQFVFFLLQLNNIATCRYGRTALEKWQIARQVQGQRPGEMKSARSFQTATEIQCLYPLCPQFWHYFQSLQVVTLPPVPGSAEISISDFAKSCAYAGRSLRQYVEAHKKQNMLDNWLQPCSTSSLS